MDSGQFKEARQKMGLTQKQLAELSSISQPMISWYETGKRLVPGYIAKLIECLAEKLTSHPSGRRG